MAKKKELPERTIESFKGEKKIISGEMGEFITRMAKGNEEEGKRLCDTLIRASIEAGDKSQFIAGAFVRSVLSSKDPMKAAKEYYLGLRLS